ncbi:MAG: DUF3467 domain-containing protein [Chloroflexi bacterium]|nr:DUF3467 domain-containing protein [Ardenticatenaceae bacterium]MBL1127846.1 DUF3467 domain-containing protein [Chloroflexota bacterium]NOG33915.1 DUF3467 domain-containing protein [Chloroflexota bacterium]GIK55599.1 MAG: hypothetical protein BroJett015_12620 [Chloroflexota bacterium]
MSEQPAPETPQPLTPLPQRITIDMPKELTAVYANVAFISHTPAEVIIDFAQVLPRTPRGKILSRIIMSPMHAKMLHTALAQSLATFEQQFGPIRLPTNLAEQFFRFPPPEGGDKEE